jgi:hypothetical protein
MPRIRALRASLNRDLFPEPPRRESPIGRLELTVLVGALVALGVVLQLLRIGWSSSLDTVWAEDGPIFLQVALEQGVAQGAFATYAGYLVLVPRLIGEGATLVPLNDAAAAISILSAAVVALSGLAVWYASGGHIRDPYLRGALAILTVLVPVAGQESIDSAAYVPWYMLFATFWLLLWRPQTLWSASLGGLFVLATALSTPGVWFFLPVAILRAIAVRDRRDLAIVGPYAVGAIVQAPVVALNTEEAVDPAWTHDIWAAFLQRVLDGAALGLRLGGLAWSNLGWPFLIALSLLAVAGLLIGLRRSDATGRWIAAICVPTSLLLFAVSVYQRAVGSQVAWPADNYNWAAGRYAIVPALLLVSAALVLVDRAGKRSPDSGHRSLAGLAAVAVLALGIVTSFDMHDGAARGEPEWRDTLTEAAAVCSAGRTVSVRVPTTPPGWGLELRCAEVEAASGS